jgi:predicted outer membrane repeat protein
VSKFAVIATSVALISALFIGTPTAVYAGPVVANDIYVGSNADATAASSCADPSFSTLLSNINTALDLALAEVDHDGDTIIICEGEYMYTADIPLHDSTTRHGVISIEAAAGADVTLDGGDQWQLLSFANMTSVSITGIKFLDAQVENDGAAIQIMGGTLNVVDSSFTEGGTATDNGGAIYSEPGHVTISGSTFTGNRAGSEGGAIFVNNAADGDGVTVSDSVFTGNNEAEGAAISVDGAASSAIITVTDSEFVNNDGEYGAITIDNGSVELTNVLMDGNNNTTGEGGAVYAEENLNVTNSEFTNNSSADDTGGAIYNYGDTIVIGSLFSGNVADDDGGAIYNERGSLLVTSSQFTNNSSGESDEGGAIQVEDCDEVSVSGSTFRNNTAGDEGGGAININCDADADVLVSRNTFTGNSARRYGGAIDQEDEDFVIRYVRNTFTGNSVTDKTTGALDQRGGQGGAVWAYTATFSGNRFTRNRASEFGGAVYTPDRQVARSAKRSKFSGNRARRGPDVYLSRLGNGE